MSDGAILTIDELPEDLRGAARQAIERPYGPGALLLNLRGYTRVGDEQWRWRP